MTEILVTPEQLAAQSVEMAGIKNEFDGLQAQLSNALVRMNEAWSPNMSNNFSSKIQSAQKSFMSVLNMLDNGSSAARIGASTFDGNINGVMEMMAGDSSLAAWIGSNAGMSDLTSGWIGAQLSLGKTPEEIMSTVGLVDQGNYQGALKDAGVQNGAINWIIDTAAEITGKATEKVKWVDAVGMATGGSISTSSLIKGYVKNMGHAAVDNGMEMADSIRNGDWNAALNSGFKAGWELSAGSLLKTSGDTAVGFVEKYFPKTYQWYADRGATDAEGMLGVLNGSIYEMITGDTAGAKQVQNYYSDHGGVAQGVIDGAAELGSYAVQKLGDLWTSIF